MNKSRGGIRRTDLIKIDQRRIALNLWGWNEFQFDGFSSRNCYATKIMYRVGAAGPIRLATVSFAGSARRSVSRTTSTSLISSSAANGCVIDTSLREATYFASPPGLGDVRSPSTVVHY